MKKLLSIGVVLITVGIFSCQKDKIIANNATTKASGSITTDQTLNVRTVPYVWYINSFFVNGENITWRFADFTFDIQAPQLMTGTYNIVAVFGGNKYNGNWDKLSLDQVTIRFPDLSTSPQSDILYILNYLNNVWVLKDNQTYDLSLRTNGMLLSFHTNGDTWPPNK